MGLKTTYYEIKKLGITLPEAYAVIDRIVADRGRCYASFAVSTSRENALKKEPLERVEINFEYSIANDNIDLFALAYEKAKGTAVRQRWNEKTQAVEDYEEAMPFNGWQDDIR
jgi:hypothetical protein